MKRPSGRRANSKGRSRSGPTFVQLFHFMMDSAAWKCLKPVDRCVLLELMRRYNGANNGRISLGVRDAARLVNANKDTVCKSFDRLEKVGFIECAQEGSFDYKERHTAEWRLTWRRCDRTGELPSHAFQRWSPPDGNWNGRSEKRGQPVRKERTDDWDSL